MVGRTPEYLGKKIEAKEMKLAMLYMLIFPAMILGFSAWSSVAGYGTSSLNNAGPHGLSEILYAYSSGAGNNGSAFAGLNANTPWYNVTLALAMLAGRFLMIVPILGIAGSMVGKKIGPGGTGHVSHRRRAVRRSPRRRRADRRSSDVLPGAVARSHRRAFSRAQRLVVLMSARKQISSFDPKHPPAGRSWRASEKLRPRHLAKNPVMFVVAVGSVLTTVLCVRRLPCASGQRGAALVHRVDRRCGSGSPCSSRTSPRRWRRGAERRRLRRFGRCAAKPRRAASSASARSACRFLSQEGRPGRRGGRRAHPGRRRRRGRRRVGRRVGDHRRVRAGHPRVGRRSLRGDGRHEGAFGPDRRPDHGEPRGIVPRPDDRARRGRRAAEDPERDRSPYSARGA